MHEMADGEHYDEQCAEPAAYEAYEVRTDDNGAEQLGLRREDVGRDEQGVPAEDEGNQGAVEDPGWRIFVGGLNWNIDDQSLGETFEKFGQVKSAKVRRKKLTCFYLATVRC